jgi:hypothetical protein
MKMAKKEITLLYHFNLFNVKHIFFSLSKYYNINMSFQKKITKMFKRIYRTSYDPYDFTCSHDMYSDIVVLVTCPLVYYTNVALSIPIHISST